MSAPPAAETRPKRPPAPTSWSPRPTRDKEYPEGVLRVNEAGSEIELRQWMGKKKRAETVVARFRLEPNADVRVDGPILRVSELSVTLESPGVAGEVAELLRRPARELETVKLVTDAEAVGQRVPGGARGGAEPAFAHQGRPAGRALRVDSIVDRPTTQSRWTRSTRRYSRDSQSRSRR